MRFFYSRFHGGINTNFGGKTSLSTTCSSKKNELTLTMRKRSVLSPVALLLVLQAALLVVDSLSLVPDHISHKISHIHHHSDRRAFIAKTLLTSSCCAPALLQPTPSFAAEEATTNNNRNGKPYAPLEALLPATRLKLWVDDVYTLSKELSTQTNNNRQQQLLTTHTPTTKPPIIHSTKTIPRR